MAYTIIEGGTTEEIRVYTTIWTTVQFDFLDYPIDIPHFEPQSEQDVIDGIANREIVEKNKLENPII